jgi:hypothetical protein
MTRPDLGPRREWRSRGCPGSAAAVWRAGPIRTQHT